VKEVLFTILGIAIPMGLAILAAKIKPDKF